MYLASSWKCLPVCVQEAERQRQEDAREDFPANRGWSFIEAAHWIDINQKNPPISTRIPYDSIGFHAKNYSMVMLQAIFPTTVSACSFDDGFVGAETRCCDIWSTTFRKQKNGCIPSCERSHIPCSKASSKMMFLFLRWKNVSSLEGVIGIFLMPRRFGERPQATVPSCYLDECQQLFLWKKGFRLDGFFGKGTFTQKKAICINLFIWNFKLVSLSSQPNGSQLGSHSGQSLIFRYNKV